MRKQIVLTDTVPTSHSDQHWMQLALDQARIAANANEVPVGAVVVHNNAVIGSGHNAVISNHDATDHAEIAALRSASHTLANYRLPATTLYVTLEPCVMCVGAMLHARIGRVVFGALEPKTGAVVSQFRLLDDPAHSHQIDWSAGVLADESAAILRDFFAGKREQS